MNIKECSNCKTKYELSYTRIPMRDKDKINCEVCKKVLITWNEAKIWDAKKIS